MESGQHKNLLGVFGCLLSRTNTTRVVCLSCIGHKGTRIRYAYFVSFVFGVKITQGDVCFCFGATRHPKGASVMVSASNGCIWFGFELEMGLIYFCLFKFNLS